jgi:hypothetical protein
VAVAAYEVFPSVKEDIALQICGVVLVILGLVALYYVVLGAACPAPLGKHPMGFRQWIRAYPVGKETIYLSILVSIAFAAAHFFVVYDEAIARKHEHETAHKSSQTEKKHAVQVDRNEE